jgi:hypothetical protein
MVAAVRRGSHPPRIAPPSLRLPCEPISGAQVGNILVLADRLAAIREDVKAEAREMGTRRNLAFSIGTVNKPLTILRPTQVLQPRIVVRGGPIAADREPCPRCATRGDIGCAHQRPMGTQ